MKSIGEWENYFFLSNFTLFFYTSTLQYNIWIEQKWWFLSIKKPLHYHASKATWHEIRGWKTHLLHSFLLWHLRAFFYCQSRAKGKIIWKKVKFEFSQRRSGRIGKANTFLWKWKCRKFDFIIKMFEKFFEKFWYF